MKQAQRVLADLQALALTKGTNAKKDFLRGAAGQTFKRAIRWYLDPNVVTGIADKKLMKDCRAYGAEAFKKINDIDDLMDYLAANNSGRDADVGVVQLFADNVGGMELSMLVYGFAKKRLEPSLGVDAKSVNSVYGEGYVPVFEVMLADKWQDVPDDFWTDKRFVVQPKHDGFRMVAFKRNGEVEIIARSGAKVEGLVEVEQAVRDLPVDNVVLDGERLPVGFDKMDASVAFKKVSESTRDGDKKGICLAVYDFMTTAEWDAKNCKKKYHERYAEYHKLLRAAGSKFLVATENLYDGTDTKEVVRLLEEAKANKKEGVMVKIADGLYEWDRGTAIVKVKVMEDSDLVVVGFTEGTGKYKGLLGALVVEYKGNKVGVGSGLSDEMRKKIWADRDSYVGKVAEVIHGGESEDKNGSKSLRWPRFKTFK